MLSVFQSKTNLTWFEKVIKMGLVIFHHGLQHESRPSVVEAIVLSFRNKLMIRKHCWFTPVFVEKLRLFGYRDVINNDKCYVVLYKKITWWLDLFVLVMLKPRYDAKCVYEIISVIDSGKSGCDVNKINLMTMQLGLCVVVT